jgi:eukaryotic-like serine/threonine-protein kinase
MSGVESRGSRVGGHYRILERIGRGGMGTVYRVNEERSGKILALKMLGGVLELQHLRRETLRFQR